MWRSTDPSSLVTRSGLREPVVGAALVGVVQVDGEVPVPVGPPAGTVEAFGERVGQTMLDRTCSPI
jgi:hypothetical protein